MITSQDVSWSEIESLVEKLSKNILKLSRNFSSITTVSRGGLIAKGLETRTDLVAYIKQIGITSTYLKSASYLMHRPTFSIIRNLILSESENILQDDSGIPVQGH